MQSELLYQKAVGLRTLIVVVINSWLYSMRFLVLVLSSNNGVVRQSKGKRLHTQSTSSTLSLLQTSLPVCYADRVFCTDPFYMMLMRR